MISPPNIPTAARAICSSALILLPALAWAKETPPPVATGKDGRLAYEDLSRGDRVPDFSHAGYRGGGVPLPEVRARIRVSPGEGDDGARIQAAIDYIAGLPADTDGTRGAVLLDHGHFEIAGQLRITAGGVVLRGSGTGEDGTILIATGTDRRTLVSISGAPHPGIPDTTIAVTVTDDYVPVGSRKLRLTSTEGLKNSSLIVIERASPPEWLAQLGMDVAPARQPYSWKPGCYNIRWDRTITAIDGDTITLDSPLTTAIDRTLAGATVTVRDPSGLVTECGVENLRLVSDFDLENPLDEQHAWNAIDLQHARDAWVSDVTGVHFSGSLVHAGDQVTRVTVQDCQAIDPISELGGSRRMAFHNLGQQVLFQRCRSEHGGNDFTTGDLAAGPNVFLDCTAAETKGFSGSTGSWSSGLLFDGVKIDGGALRLDNLETWNQGVGWAAANSMIWQCQASNIVSRQPPGAHNWVVASWGQFMGNGSWSATNQFARPASLYCAQLDERCGKGALAALEPRHYPTPPATPSLEQAVPDLASRLAAKPAPAGKPLAVVDGVLMAGDKRISGKQTSGAWWLGRLETDRASEAGPALTRFAPGRVGPGYTDDLSAVAANMEVAGQVAYRHHQGLWYDRRRIDHQMIRRPDADVWPPFFEQPFARSGRGSAWDGLSRYDLAKYNPWYFERLRTFATEARLRGLVLINEMYFQHNVLESGAHWVDSPWRPVNNINDTGFIEPPPFTGDTIRMAAEFYNETHPVRRELHRSYIRHHLDVLGIESNVIHTLTAENSGPLHFMQFWLDVIAEWERETGKHPVIALSAPKDIQDAILADPKRASVIDVIDLTYWFRTDDGHEFAPPGGDQFAPRQHLRQWKDGRPSAASISQMAREYREKHPGKAVITGLPEAVDIQP
jgi:hypothetical protein